MARRVVSVLRGPCGAAARTSDPALEANAYAVAEEVSLTLVLRGASVELAVAGARAVPVELAGAALPPLAASQDLRGLVESGVAVHACGASLRARGIPLDALLRGVRVAEADDLAMLLRQADAVLAW
jgi:intracellular sulfur oxidation DsrE/DsrF family protein